MKGGTGFLENVAKSFLMSCNDILGIVRVRSDQVFSYRSSQELPVVRLVVTDRLSVSCSKKSSTKTRQGFVDEGLSVCIASRVLLQCPRPP